MTINDISRLVLGTAQLGMNYGVANRTGQPDFKTAESIIKMAWKSGIHEFDTAQGYGESERVLGKALHSLGISSNANVVTKLHPDLDHLNQDDLDQALEKSLSGLKISKLYGIMLHRERFLGLWDKGLGEILNGFVRSGLVEHLGVSVYSPAKAIEALKTVGISIVQFPTNLLDHRFDKAGVFRLAEDNGKQIYVRSVFLQGLLLVNSDNLPANMQFAFEVLKMLEVLSQETGLSKQDLALGYVKQAFPKAKIVFGVETLGQLNDNLKSWKSALPVDIIEYAQEEFKYVEERVLNPTLWSC
ncbi:aldo/keto reductase [bacterium]|nr:aldo/keto reductase [bacterium]